MFKGDPKMHVRADISNVLGNPEMHERAYISASIVSQGTLRYMYELIYLMFKGDGLRYMY